MRHVDVAQITQCDRAAAGIARDDRHNRRRQVQRIYASVRIFLEAVDTSGVGRR
jgi:hypothetical protein